MLRGGKKPKRPISYFTLYFVRDLRVPLRRMAGSTMGDSIVCGSMIEIGMKDLEGGSLVGVWDGDGVSETGDRPLMESGEVAAARLGVMRLPYVHAYVVSRVY